MSVAFHPCIRALTGLLACACATGSAWAADLNVPADFATIQAAIDAAAAEDVVVIEPGVYTENLILKSNITLRGLETARTIVRSTTGAVMQIANSTTGVVIRNLTFSGGEIGIQITGSTNIEIHNNVFALGNAGTAITVDNFSPPEIDIRHNTFHGNSVGIGRASIEPVIINNIFNANTISIENGSIAGDVNISFNCFAIGETLIGDNPTAGEILFADTAALDFHLQEDSGCIDAGAGDDDVFSPDDEDEPDAGAYGGPFADTVPFPVGEPESAVSDSATAGLFDVTLSWEQNLSYLTTGYEIHYDSDRSGEPYEGEDAADMNGDPTPSPVQIGEAGTYTLFNLLSNPAVPAAPALEAVAPSNRTLDLRWTAVEGATGYRIEYGIAAADENQVDVGNVTSHEIGGLENGTTYRVRVSAMSNTVYHFALKVLGTTGSGTDTSVFSPDHSVTVGPAQVSMPSNELTGIPEEVVPFPMLPNQGGVNCFIATAAYGHFSHPQVQLLRDFRDRYLLTNTPGRAFVGWYYRHSPGAAEVIARHDMLRMLVRWALLPLIGMAFLMMQAPALTLALAALLCLLTGAVLAGRAARASRTT